MNTTPKLQVSHGKTTHLMSEPCEECQHQEAWNRQPTKPEYTKEDMDEAIKIERERIKDLVEISIELLEQEEMVYKGYTKELLELIDLQPEETRKTN